MSQLNPSLKLLFSFGYWFGAHSLGLILHPYQSVRKIVRDQFYRPLVFLPGVSLICWWVVGAIIARFNVLATLRLSLVAQAIDLISFKQYLFSFIFIWGVLFLSLWQILLGYLYWRFSRLLNSKFESRNSK